MAKLVCMPAVSANAEQALLVEWAVKEGDAVHGGDSLGGIETDKAVVDLQAEQDGVIARLLVAPGTSVAVGAPVAVLLEPGDTDADVQALLGPPPAAGAEPPGGTGRPMPQSAAPSPAPERVFASPLARRRAKEAGVSLQGLQGSGPNGRIVKRDIERVRVADVPLPAEAPAQDSAAPATPASLAEQAFAGAIDARQPAPPIQPSIKSSIQPSIQPSGFDLVPHTSMRLAIARRLAESKATIPHFYLRGQCRMDALLALRAQLNAVAPRKLSLNDLAIRATACALRDVPGMNVTWTPEGLRHHHHADIAVAVATEGGLITPILQAADQLGVVAIGTEMADRVQRARAGRLAPSEYEGGTFGISNLGMYGVAEFAAIINPPQSAMLALGAATREAVVIDATVQAATVMRYTLSVDHRAIDGVLAARWLARYTYYMEQPLAMLV
jgi:pyruvate dehydrogenase E2 component (dihydrolipoamide acetyltransferase)